MKTILGEAVEVSGLHVIFDTEFGKAKFDYYHARLDVTKENLKTIFPGKVSLNIEEISVKPTIDLVEEFCSKHKPGDLIEAKVVLEYDYFKDQNILYEAAPGIICTESRFVPKKEAQALKMGDIVLVELRSQYFYHIDCTFVKVLLNMSAA